MKPPASGCNRRTFLRHSLTLAAGAPFALRSAAQNLTQTPQTSALRFPSGDPKVAIVSCKTYDAKAVTESLRQAFDYLGGLGRLVQGKTVAVKLNLTSTNFAPVFGRPAGETFMTHSATVMALTTLLFQAGAKRVRFLESTNSRATLESTLSLADWDIPALQALGRVEFENTRNLGLGKRYSHLSVAGGGYFFSGFDLNHSYEDTDVFVSMAKLKNHVTAGVTLAMKNIFGITPNSLYGDQAGNENALAGRGPLHSPVSGVKLPNLKQGATSRDPGQRVPRIIADLAAARPIHLSIIDGITSMKGGEGPWTGNVAPLAFTNPGVIVAGLNPVSTDAVATAVMGYADPRAARATKPFENCENHLLLAEKAGVGPADLSQIDVRGLTIAQAVYRYG